MNTQALPTKGDAGPAPTDSPARRGVCGVLCGALAVGACLQIFAAAVAVAVAIVMVTIAVAGPVAPWVGVAAVIVLGAIGTCIWRNRHQH
ncbi:MAG: hypothetical protein KQH83_04110 [Actinobacteria bacterium]|nr:hypothetical protein [Actinomycetota bacterium]